SAKRRQSAQLKLALRAAAVGVFEQRNGRRGVRLALQKLVKPRERARRELAVGIEQENISPARVGECAIRRRGEAVVVRRSDQARVAVEALERVVSRSVV